jgi:hypothetical protein
MKAELRDRLGKAAYGADHDVAHSLLGDMWRMPEWETLLPVVREKYSAQAEAIVLALAEILIPQLQYVALVLTDRPVEITLGEPTASWPVEEGGDHA